MNGTGATWMPARFGAFDAGVGRRCRHPVGRSVAPAAQQPEFAAALRLASQPADLRAVGIEAVPERRFVAHFFPFVVEPENGVGGGGDLRVRRTGEPARENGFEFLPVDHDRNSLAGSKRTSRPQTKRPKPASPMTSPNGSMTRDTPSASPTTIITKP